jgi:hypothetical protein
VTTEIRLLKRLLNGRRSHKTMPGRFDAGHWHAPYNNRNGRQIT